MVCLDTFARVIKTSTLLSWLCHRLSMLVYYGAWMGGIAILFVPLWEFYLFSSFRVLMCLGLYFSYRALTPIKRSHLSHAFQAAWHTHFPYFPTQEIVFDASQPSIQPTSKTLLCVHPHGILCCGWTLAASSQAFLPSKMSWLVADILTYVPFFSNLMIPLGGGSAAKKNMLRLMSEGENIALLPGGFEEATLYVKDTHRVFLSRRKGFINYALRHGYTIIPSYVFGEEQTYWTLNGATRLRLWLNQFHIPSVLFFGTWWCGFCPRRVPLTLVLGPGLSVTRVPEPTPAQVEALHTRYVTALVKLFDTHKKTYGIAGTETLQVF